MTTREIKNMIDETGIQNAYYQFEDGRELAPPWICFRYPASDDVYADDSNYQYISALTIELYTPYKDFASERTIEGVLRSHGFSWAKSEAYVDDEKLYMTIYEMEVLIDA